MAKRRAPSFEARAKGNAKRRINNAIGRAAAPLAGPFVLFVLAWLAWDHCAGADKREAAERETAAADKAQAYRDRLVDSEAARVRAAFATRAPKTIADATAAIGIPPTDCGRGGRAMGGSNLDTYALWRFRAEIPDPEARVYQDPKGRGGAGELHAGQPVRLKVRACDPSADVIEVVATGGAR
jgi:hypothetical protein